MERRNFLKNAMGAFAAMTVVPKLVADIVPTPYPGLIKMIEAAPTIPISLSSSGQFLRGDNIWMPINDVEFINRWAKRAEDAVWFGNANSLENVTPLGAMEMIESETFKTITRI